MERIVECISAIADGHNIYKKEQKNVSMNNTKFSNHFFQEIDDLQSVLNELHEYARTFNEYYR